MYFICVSHKISSLKRFRAGGQWLMLVILLTQETEIRRITVQSQPWQIVCEPLSGKKPKTQKGGSWWSGSKCRP
jgi:hypothetical protein